MGRSAFISSRVMTGYLQDDMEIFTEGTLIQGNESTGRDSYQFPALVQYHGTYTMFT